ncbi:MAG: hypothetical protein ACQERZ_02720 [Fusobacteriota bacterium]
MNRNMLEGFNERIKNIAVFKPIFELQQKRKYDYPIMELGISVMLYIFDKMLQGDKSCTYQNIAYYLQDLLKDNFNKDLNYDEGLELAHHIVRENLMNYGKSHKLEYYDFESQTNDTHRFNLIELEDYEVNDKMVKLKLSTTGLELLFKTKEIYNELQVSISQLYLRQQIEKGVFDGALQTVEELELAVKNEKEKLRNLRERIIRDVLEVTKEGEYEKSLEQINNQLVREKNIFYELRDLVEEALNKYYSNNFQKRDANKIMKLKNRLIDIMSLHETLFTDKLRIESLMNETIESMILNVFDTKLNFETEILESIVRNKKGLDIVKKVLDPIFSAKINPVFNPNRIFEEQTFSRNKETPEEKLWELQQDRLKQEEEEEKKRKVERKKRVKRYLELLLLPLKDRKFIKLSEVLNNLKSTDNKKYNELIKEVEFYPFLIKLHQLDKIPIELDDENGFVLDDLYWSIVSVAEMHPEIARLDGFELEALDSVIKLDLGYVLSDYKIASYIEEK